MALPNFYEVELCTDDYEYIVKHTKCQSCKYIRYLSARCKHCKLEICECCAIKYACRGFECKRRTKMAGTISKHELYLVKELK